MNVRQKQTVVASLFGSRLFKNQMITELRYFRSLRRRWGYIKKCFYIFLACGTHLIGRDQKSWIGSYSLRQLKRHKSRFGSRTRPQLYAPYTERPPGLLAGPHFGNWKNLDCLIIWILCDSKAIYSTSLLLLNHPSNNACVQKQDFHFSLSFPSFGSSWEFVAGKCLSWLTCSNNKSSCKTSSTNQQYVEHDFHFIIHVCRAESWLPVLPLVPRCAALCWIWIMAN
jgi:hypothetical protein